MRKSTETASFARFPSDPDAAIDPAVLPRRLHDVVADWAVRAPRNNAVSDDGGTWTYAGLDAAGAAAAAWLAGLGVRGGDRLMIVNENCRALVALILGASRLDAWAVIVNARLSARETEAIRDHSDSRRVVFTTAVSENARAHAEHFSAKTLSLPMLGEVAVGPLHDAAPEPVCADPAQQVAVMIYTTGTTGNPKGVMLSHRNILFVSATSGRARRMAPDDINYGVLPVSHIYGVSSMLLGSLQAGSHVRLVARFSATALLDALAAGATVCQGVPAMWAHMLEQAAREKRPIVAPRLRYISVGGAPLDGDLKARVEAALGLPLHNGYGLTEASPTVSLTRVDAPTAAGDISTGPALPGIATRIVDAQGHDVAAGDTGELWVRGAGVMLGYYRDRPATEAVITGDGWLKTGDLVMIDQRQSIHIVGRAKELIIRSGFNVYPPEVEAVLNSHPQVIHSAVVGRRVPDNEEVVAYVELQPGATVSAAEIAAFAAERLAPYKKPSEIVIMDSLPATSTGKILKARLRDLARGIGAG